MKSITKYLKYTLLLLSIFVYYQCTENDNEIVSDDPQISMAAPTSPGHAQYKFAVESGYDITVPLSITSSSNLKSVKVTKTVNLEVDPSFGNDGTLTILSSSGESTYNYTFSYLPSTEDVDQLIGFTFEAENENGKVSQSDLTLAVTLSPRDNLPRRRWNLTSVLWVSNENLESINECEKDNSMLLNEDGTTEVDYGTDTGSGSCAYDGLTAYDSWELTDDDQHFIRTSHGIFTPDISIIDTFVVRSLTIEEFAIEQTVDMSVFGLGTDEKFLYVYEAGPR